MKHSNSTQISGGLISLFVYNTSLYLSIIYQADLFKQLSKIYQKTLISPWST